MIAVSIFSKMTKLTKLELALQYQISPSERKEAIILNQFLNLQKLKIDLIGECATNLFNPEIFSAINSLKYIKKLEIRSISHTILKDTFSSKYSRSYNSFW